MYVCIPIHACTYTHIGMCIHIHFAYVCACTCIHAHKCMSMHVHVCTTHMCTLYTHIHINRYIDLCIYTHMPTWYKHVCVCTYLKFWVVFQIFLVNFYSLLLCFHTFNSIFYFLKHIKYSYCVLCLMILYLQFSAHTVVCCFFLMSCLPMCLLVFYCKLCTLELYFSNSLRPWLKVPPDKIWLSFFQTLATLKHFKFSSFSFNGMFSVHLGLNHVGKGSRFLTLRKDSLAPLKAETGSGMCPVPPSVQRFLFTYKDIFLVVLALGTGRHTQH